MITTQATIPLFSPRTVPNSRNVQPAAFPENAAPQATRVCLVCTVPPAPMELREGRAALRMPLASPKESSNRLLACPVLKALEEPPATPVSLEIKVIPEYLDDLEPTVSLDDPAMTVNPDLKDCQDLWDLLETLERLPRHTSSPDHQETPETQDRGDRLDIPERRERVAILVLLEKRAGPDHLELPGISARLDCQDLLEKKAQLAHRALVCVRTRRL